MDDCGAGAVVAAAPRTEEDQEPESFDDAAEEFSDGPDGGEDAEGDYRYALHRAAFYNDAARIRRLAGSLSAEQLAAHDVHGNSALHVAALRRATAAAEALVAAGLRPGAKSARGWTALEEALAARDHATAKVLHSALLSAARADLKAKRAALLAAMRSMPDYTMKLTWRLGSSVPGLGMLLRRYAPADTYTIWKVGDRLRVDGTLMGLDTSSSSLIPEWKRGRFSLVLDGSGVPPSSGGVCGAGGDDTRGGGAGTGGRDTSDGAGASGGSVEGGAGARGSSSSATVADGPGCGGWPTGAMAGTRDGTACAATAMNAPPAGCGGSAGGSSSAGGGSGGRSPRLLFLHHGKQRWVDLGADRKAMKDDEAAALEEELLAALERDVDKQRFKPRGFKFAPLRGWLGGELRESVGGWSCAVYEAAGKLVGVTTAKAGWDLPEGATFEEYLAHTPPPDCVEEVVFDPLNPSAYDPLRGGGGGDGGAASGRRRASDDGGASDGDGGDLAGALAGDLLRRDDGSRRRGGGGGGGGGGWWGGGGGGSSDAARPKGGGGGGRTLRARLWMARGFPMSLAQLVPLLEVIGAANKQLAKVGRFMAKYAALELFPVRVHVPLLLTLYAAVGFSDFAPLARRDAPGVEFFQVPDGWTRRSLNDMLDKHTGGLLAAGPGRGPRRRNGHGRVADSDEEDDFLRTLGDVDWT